MQNKLRKIEDFFRSARPPYKWEWIVLGILIFIPFISCFYGDTMSILIYENHFFGAIMDGDGLLSYYDYVMNNLGTGNYATYDFPMYIVLGIWGAPLWFFWGAKGISPLSSFVAKIYGKSIFLAAFAVTVFLVYFICKELKVSKERAIWGAFIYASSVMIYVSICLNGQTDILGLVFILAGILSYVRGRNVWFIIFYAIAVPFKMYALFTFVPLLLLREKKIWKIGVQTLGAISIRVISNMLFDPSSPAIQEKARFESELFNRLTAQRLPLLNGSVPVVILLLGVVCVFCYLKQIESKEELDKYSVFIPLLAMGCLFVSFESSSYWYLHLTPFLAIMLVYNWGNMKICMLFESVAMICLTAANYATRAWAFEIYFYPEMALGKLFGDYNALETPVMLIDLCGRVGLVKYAGCVYAVYTVLLFTVIFLSRPSKINREGENIPIRGYAVLRLAANAFVAYIPAILYLYNVYLAHKS